MNYRCESKNENKVEQKTPIFSPFLRFSTPKTANTFFQILK